LRRLRIDGQTWVPASDWVQQEDQPFSDGIDQGSVVLIDTDHGTYTAEAGFDVPIERVIGPEPSFDACI
jgi:hypothetical protein